MKLTALAALAAAFCVVAEPIEAAPLLFELTGGLNAQFQLDSSPTPDLAFGGYFFVVNGVAGLPGTTAGFGDLGFYHIDAGGGLVAFDAGTDDLLFGLEGPQLYAGPEITPMFMPGIFALIDSATGSEVTLTISSISGAIPEPASWALMIGGFALTGAALRGRARLRARAA